MSRRTSQVVVTATDNGGLNSSNATTFEYLTCIGIDIDAPAINFGLINPGENSTVLGDANFATLSNVTIKNMGNIILDVQLKGTNLTSDGNVIAVGNIFNDLGDDGYDPLNETLVEYDELDLVAGANSLHKANFRLHVPWGTLPGNYNGTLTNGSDSRLKITYLFTAEPTESTEIQVQDGISSFYLFLKLTFQILFFKLFPLNFIAFKFSNRDFAKREIFLRVQSK